jgi:transcriptional regulator of acetoin/glycerol metabolism
LRGFTEAARTALLQYSGPGNVRELEHVIERAVILAKHEFIDAPELNLTAAESAANPRAETLDEVERATIERALREHSWNVTRAAQALGLTRQALYRRMEKFRLT